MDIITEEEAKALGPKETLRVIMYRTLVAKGLMTDEVIYDFRPEKLTPREQFLISSLTGLAEELIYAATRKH